MRVIKEGTAKPRYPWLGRWRCTECGTVAVLEEADHGHVTHTDHQRDGESVLVPCPICERRTMWLRAPVAVMGASIEELT